MKHTRVVSTKCTPGFACRAFSDTTLVCFIVNEHTTKCSHYIAIAMGPFSSTANFDRTIDFEEAFIRNHCNQRKPFYRLWNLREGLGLLMVSDSARSMGNVFTVQN